MYKNKVKLQQGFKVIGREQVLDDRLVLTREDLLKIKAGAADDYYELARWPQQYFSVVIDSEGKDAQLYLFNKNNTYVGSEGDPSHIGLFDRVDYEYIKKHPSINGIELVGDHDGEYYRLQTKLAASQGIKLTDGVDPVSGKVVQFIEVLVDGKTIKFDANGKLTAIIHGGKALDMGVNSAGEPVADVLFDDKTIKLNSANQLELPIDYSTIVIDSQGKLQAVPEPLADGVATHARYDGRNEVVDVLFDNVTIILNSEGKLAGADQLHSGIANEMVPDGAGSKKLNVLFDGSTIDVNANKLKVVRDNKTIIVGSEGLEVPIDNKTIRLAGGKIVATPESLVDGKATHAYYDSEDERVDVLVDDASVKINVNNKLEVKTGEAIQIDPQGVAVKHDHTLLTNGSNELGIALVEGKAIDVVNYNEINVLADDKSIKVDANNKLAAIKDDKTLKVGSEGLFVNIDNDSLYVDAVTGYVKAKQEALIADKAIEIDNTTHKVSVKFDDKSIGRNASNQLEAKVDAKSLIIGSEGLAANIDNKTIKLNGANKLEAQPIDEKTIIYNADGKLETQIGGWKQTTASYTFATIGGLADARTITVPWAGAACPEAGQTITFSSKVGTLPVITGETFTLVDDGFYIKGENPSNTYIDVVRFKKDLSEIELTFDAIVTPSPSLTYSAEFKGDANVYHLVDGKYLPVDNNTIILNTAGKLQAVAKDLIAGEAIVLGSDGSINVLYDNNTIILNSEGKLKAVDELPIYSAAQEDKFLRVNSEGKLEWHAAGKVDDVKIDGVSIVDANKIANIPLGTSEEYGVVKFDGDTLKLNSEGRLAANIKGLVADVLTKVDPAGTYGSVVTNNKAYIDLSEYATDSEAAHSINFTMDSEFKLTLSLYNVLGDKIDEDMVDLPLEEMIIDGKFVRTSEGGYIVLTLKNGNVINVPLDQLVDGLVNLRGAQTIVGSKDFTGKLTRLGQEVLSVLNVDGVTIKWNDSEGFIEATGLEVKAGDGIEVISSGVSSEGKPIKLLNVLTDDKTVKVNANNKLEAMFADGLTLGSEGEKLKVDVDNKTLKIDANKLKVNIDGMTLRYNTSEDYIEATGIDIKAGDAVEINLDSESTPTKIIKRLDVLADDKSIEIDANNKLAAKFDKKTIILDNSEGLKTQIGGWKEVASAYPFVQYSGTVTTSTLVQAGQVPTQVPEAGEAAICDVVWDGTSATVVLGMWEDDGLWMKSEDTMASYVTKVRVKKDLTATEVTFKSTAPILAGGSTVTVVAKSNSNIYHKADGKYMPIDNSTIMLDANGNMKAVAKDLIGGEAISIASDSSINVLYDDKTVCLDSENNLYIPIDDLTIKVNSEGKLSAMPEPLKDGIATAIRYEGRDEVVDVLFDEATIFANSENKLEVIRDEVTIKLDSEGLYVPIDNKTIVISSEGLVALPIDEQTIILNSEGKLQATFQKSEAERPIEVDSEGVIKLHYNKGLLVSSEGDLEVDYDGLTIMLDSEGHLMAVPEPLKDGIATKAYYNSEGKEVVDVLFDDKTIILDSEGKLQTQIGGWKEETAEQLTNLFINTKGNGLPTYIGPTGTTYYEVGWDYDTTITSLVGSDTEAIIKTKFTVLGSTFDGNVTLHKQASFPIVWQSDDLIIGGATYKIKVQDQYIGINNGGLTVAANDTGADLSDSTMNSLALVTGGAGVTYHPIDANYVPIDNDTIVINSEGKLNVNFEETLIDEKTIIRDSEGKLETQIGGWLEKDVLIPELIAILNSEPPIDSEGKVFVYHNVDTSKIQGTMGFEAEFDVMITSHTYKKTATFVKLVPRNVYEFVDALDHLTWTLDADNNELIAECTAGVMPVAPYIYGKLYAKVLGDKVHFVDNKFIDIDDNTIVLDSEGKLSAASQTEAIPVADVIALWESLV